MRLVRVITLKNRADLVEAVKRAPLGARLDLVDDPRTLQQNKMMWSLLRDVAEQVKHADEYWEPDDWKCAFMKLIGLRMHFMPSLDGEGVVAIGYQSSKLDKEKFSELIHSIIAYGDRKGVQWSGAA